MPEKCVYEYIRADHRRGCYFKPESNDLCSEVDPIDPEKCEIIIRIRDWNSRVAQRSAKYQDSKENFTPTDIKEATDLINAARSPFGSRVLSLIQS